MGLLLSVIISYVGFHEALECMKHIINGIVPDTEPYFNDLVEYYTRLLQKTANASPRDWTKESGQGYLCLIEDKNGNLKSAAVKFYGGQPNSTAILFSTKISSFGQDSFEESSQINGDYRVDRYPTKTKTIISNSSESFSVGNRNRSTSSGNISDANPELDDNFDDGDQIKQKLSWEYKPKTPPPSPLPEILFQSYNADKNDDVTFNEEFLRSHDGIKYRPLQRSDPSFRRRSFRKRASSSSNSSRESRASREEELKIFTSLEEAEFKRMNKDENYTGFGSAPNLVARSYSRSRSREKSRERRNENTIPEATSCDDGKPNDAKVFLKDVPKMSSLDESNKSSDIPEVKEEEEDIDFWGNIED